MLREGCLEMVQTRLGNYVELFAEDVCIIAFMFALHFLKYHITLHVHRTLAANSTPLLKGALYDIYRHIARFLTVPT